MWVLLAWEEERLVNLVLLNNAFLKLNLLLVLVIERVVLKKLQYTLRQEKLQLWHKSHFARACQGGKKRNNDFMIDLESNKCARQAFRQVKAGNSVENASISLVNVLIACCFLTSGRHASLSNLLLRK